MKTQKQEQLVDTAPNYINAQFEKLLRLTTDEKVSVRTRNNYSTFFSASLMTWDESGNLDID